LGAEIITSYSNNEDNHFIGSGFKNQGKNKNQTKHLLQKFVYFDLKQKYSFSPLQET
jgi:hypothetical protein